MLRMGEGNQLKKLSNIAQAVNNLADETKALSDEELKAKTVEFKERLGRKESLDSLLPEAFAVCREASDRVLGLRPFDVQLMGGAALHFGNIAEMKTGEGKTLVMITHDDGIAAAAPRQMRMEQGRLSTLETN